MTGSPVRRAWIGLGGNQGDVAQAMRDALVRLGETPGIDVRQVSSLWRTPPWGPVAQDDFLNAAAELAVTIEPRALLEKCLEAERQAGRVRAERWGPRVLDIDILVFEGMTADEPDLVLPHPRLAERAFALLPMAELAPEMLIAGESVAARSARADTAGMRLVAAPGAWWVGPPAVSGWRD